MLEINNITIEIDGRNIIENLSFTLHNGEKLAIIGEEGNGKSTLMKSIMGICPYANIKGSIRYADHHIGYLPQTIGNEYNETKVIDYILENLDYYDIIGELYDYLNRFNLRDEILEQNISTLSGGEKIKIGILKIILEGADIYFLDEPTNDLDIDSLDWLEDFILNSKCLIMYISHDEELLANTANMILHLEELEKKTQCKHTLFNGDYETYITERASMIENTTMKAKSEKREYERAQERLDRIMRKVEHDQANISRGDPHGARLLKKKMHSLKSQERRLANTELTSIPDVEEAISFFFDEVNIPRGKTILNLDIPELKVGDRVLARNISLNVKGNEHICIIGNNGVGKSTLIKAIYDMIGSRKDLKVGYMPQNYEDELEKYEYVLDYISEGANEEEIKKARVYMSCMKLTQEEIDGKMSSLSNGTKAKLLLIKNVLDKVEVLILDEPTRNVSPLSNPVFRRVLKEFNGAIISVSHDRKYIKEVIDTVYSLDSEGLKKIEW